MMKKTIIKIANIYHLYDYITAILYIKKTNIKFYFFKLLYKISNSDFNKSIS